MIRTPVRERMMQRCDRPYLHPRKSIALSRIIKAEYIDPDVIPTNTVSTDV